MKITKRQLRRIIREEKNFEFGPEVPLLPDGTVDLNSLSDEELAHYEEGLEDGSNRDEPRDTMNLRRMADRPRVDQIYSAGYSDGVGTGRRLPESSLKITKRQLRRIIREEKARLLSEMKPADMSMHDAADYYENTASPEIRKSVAELMAAIKKGARLGVDKGAAEDELYIMTGGAEGLTVKVVRRGR